MKKRSGPRFLTRSRSLGVAACGGVIVLLSVALAQSRPQTPPQTQRPAPPGTPAAARVAGDLARGEYLVHSVAMCVQCHSPRDQRGSLIARELLTGGAVPVRGPSWDAEWAYRAPALAGLPGFTDEQIVTLLTEGHAGDRPAPRRPMPPFRMNRADAEAIASYLRSR
jgi:mono/diheme cytochrome c family protein